MNSFNYYNPARIVFGTDAQYQLSNLLKEFHTTSLLLIYSGDFIKDLGIYDVVKQVCEELRITCYENGNVVPNPKIELVRELVDLGKKQHIDFVLAVGGGSAIDSAKAVAAGIPYEHDVWDFFSYTAVPQSALPIGVISTLPASGSESSNCSIISNGLHKQGIEYDCIIPKFAIMNPEYTIGLPPYQTSCGIADILSHMLERYFSAVKHTDTTDYLIVGAIKALMINAQRLMERPDDIDARSEVQCLAFLAHNNLLDIGRAADWGSHRIEHEISAQYGITHGEGMAVIMLAWCNYMAERKPEKLAQLAIQLYDATDEATPQQLAYLVVEKLREFFKSLHLKTTLSELSINDCHFEEMADRATSQNTQTIGHYMLLDKAKIMDILKLAL